ncbi:MAG TPA: 16S rRNA (guanine(527)-N(7))-methyltransferase RsmG [Clostridiales bacterium]|nr:16S rRNA (guanine(527)-N(7))-methyltransferase RsmG [Clostridiales bacterium]
MEIFVKELLKEGFSELGISVSDDALEKLIRYSDMLKVWNEKMNLTAVCDDFGIATKHFFDSSTPLLTGYISGKVIDVGTGAGFPGMVLKILKPDIEITLLDSLKKRLSFLEEVARELDLSVNIVHARAEDGGRQMRAQFDTVVSRAVANMSVLSELCIPFLKEGGHFLALKGPLAGSELEDARRAIHILGGDILSTFSAPIPKTDLNHKIVIIKKARQTPMQYPRKAGILTKNPLGTCYNPKKKPTK